MANTITLHDTVPGRVMGLGPIRTYKFVSDGADTDLETLRTPTISTHRVFVVGVALADDSSGTLTLCSADVEELPLILAVNQGIFDKIQKDGYIFATQEGEALKVKASFAATFFISVVEGRAPEYY